MLGEGQAPIERSHSTYIWHTRYNLHVVEHMPGPEEYRLRPSIYFQTWARLGKEEADPAVGGLGRWADQTLLPLSPPAHVSETEGDLRRACPTLKSQ